MQCYMMFWHLPEDIDGSLLDHICWSLSELSTTHCHTAELCPPVSLSGYFKTSVLLALKFSCR